MRKLYVRGFSIFPPRCQTPLFITVFSSLRGRGTRTNLYKKEVMILQKEQFDITGMTCSACSTRVEKSVAKLPGIKEVSVNLLKNSMVASYDESVLDTAGIVQAVEKAGYGAIPKASAQNKSRTTTPAAKPEVSTAQAEYKQMKQRLLLSALFTIPLFYISMGHMMGWPLPSSLLGMENAISFAFTQFLLLIPVVFINFKYYRMGFKTLFQRSASCSCVKPASLRSLRTFSPSTFKSEFGIIVHFNSIVSFW